jgi:hypothetical protein
MTVGEWIPLQKPDTSFDLSGEGIQGRPVNPSATATVADCLERRAPVIMAPEKPQIAEGQPGRRHHLAANTSTAARIAVQRHD